MKKLKLVKMFTEEGPATYPPPPAGGRISPLQQQHQQQQKMLQQQRQQNANSPQMRKAIDDTQTELQNLEDISEHIRGLLGKGDIHSISQYLATLQQVAGNVAFNINSILQAQETPQMPREGLREDHYKMEPQSQKGEIEKKILHGLKIIRAYSASAHLKISSGDYNGAFGFLSDIRDVTTRTSGLLKQFIKMNRGI